MTSTYTQGVLTDIALQIGSVQETPDYLENTRLFRMSAFYQKLYKERSMAQYKQKLMTFAMDKTYAERHAQQLIEPLVDRIGGSNAEMRVAVRESIMHSVTNFKTLFFLHPKMDFSKLYASGNTSREPYRTLVRSFIGRSVATPTMLDAAILDGWETNGINRMLNASGYGVVLDELPTRADDDTRRFTVGVAHIGGIHVCSCCNRPLRSGNVEPVWTSQTTQQLMCSACRHADASIMYCQASSRWFKASDDEDDYMYGRTISAEAYVWLQYCIDDDLVEFDDDDEEYYVTGSIDEDSRLLAGYHSAPRAWLREPSVIPPDAIGVELELGFKGGGNARDAFLRKHLRATGEFARFPMVVERDGSLDSVPGGCEIISAPLPFHEGYVAENAPWRKLLKLLVENGGQGWSHREQAGIHVNVDARTMSDEEKFKFITFINNAAGLSKFISGRKVLYGRNGDKDPKHSKRKHTAFTGGYLEITRKEFEKDATPSAMLSRIIGKGKYAPVHLRNRGEALEVRIFGSNIKYEGFMACVEYCVAVKEFTKALKMVDVFSPLISSEFRAWLATKTDVYPNLAHRLGTIKREAGAAVPSDQKVAAALEAA